MAETIPFITYTHPVSGKHYTVALHREDLRTVAEERLMQFAEYEYQKSLPAERRAKRVDTNFKCPHCKTKKLPIVRKETVTLGFLFISTHLIEILICQECKNEFTEGELRQSIRDAIGHNFMALSFEKFKDGEYTHEQFEALMRNH